MANRARNTPASERIVADNNDVLETLQFKYENNKKSINTGVTIVLLAAVAIFAYLRLYKAPLEEKAAAAMYFPQSYFSIDSVDKAMNGDGTHIGFLKIMKKYGNTKVGNLCHYYAGVCYLRQGDFKNAIKNLDDFDGNGSLISYTAWGCLGDAYLESGNTKKAIDFYNKAAGNPDDQMNTPMYLYRAGVACEKNNQPEEAKKDYKRIRDEYPQSMQARDMDKYLARLGEVD